jgi:hypothetical protein
MKVGKRLWLVTSLLAIAALIAIGCPETPREPADETHDGPYPDLSDPDRFPPSVQIDVMADRGLVTDLDGGYYLPGEEAEITITFTNNNSYPVILSPFPPECRLTTRELEGEKIVRSFITDGQDLELDSGEKVMHIITWDQKDDSGQQVAYGRYYSVEIFGSTVRKASGQGSEGVINNKLDSLLVQYPQGAMEKVIEVNQSQRVSDLPLILDDAKIFSDITMTLQCIDLTPVKVTVYVLANIADAPPNFRGNPGASRGGSAQYSVDGVSKTKRSTSGGPLEGGIKRCLMIWEYLEPFPSDAKELIFTINKWGEWEGPWEFQISLE